jgi:hypothetical protein
MPHSCDNMINISHIISDNAFSVVFCFCCAMCVACYVLFVYLCACAWFSVVLASGCVWFMCVYYITCCRCVCVCVCESSGLVHQSTLIFFELRHIISFKLLVSHVWIFVGKIVWNYFVSLCNFCKTYVRDMLVSLLETSWYRVWIIYGVCLKTL